MADRNELAFLKNALSVTGTDPQEQTALENLLFTRLLTAGLTLNSSGIFGLSGVTDGQLLIGKTSDHSLNLATLTAGSNVTITNAAGSITIAAALSSLPNPITQDLLFTDATYDIGKSGATRPRDLFLSRNLAVGGTTTLVGAVISDLLFTDATYDIGKSGATRPRDIFTSRKAVVGTNFSTGAQFEVGFTSPGIALNMTRNPGVAGDEGFVAGFGYDSAGNQVKLGATSFQWTDTTAASGYASWNVHTSAINGGVQSDVYGLAIWSKQGATFFPSDLTSSSSPGASDVVKISGGRMLIGTGAANPNAILEIKGDYTGLNTFPPKGFVVQPNITVPVGLNAFGFDIAVSFVKAASGTHTDIVGSRCEPPGITGSGATVTNATTVKIEGAPSGATNNYALWITGGGTRVQGLGAFATSDKYVIVDANGNLHVSALGPVS